MNLINIKLPDNSIREYDSGITGYEIAQSIGHGLLKASVAIKVDGEVRDLHYSINNDSNVEIITNKSEDAHHILLHSTAHLLAQSIKEIFPHAKIAIGPALKETFYYDIDLDDVINESVLSKIEEKMVEISKRDYRVFRMELSHESALKKFQDLREDYKVEIISEIDENDITNLLEQGFSEDDVWDIGAIVALFALSNRMANMAGIRPNDEFYTMGRHTKH